MGADYNLYPHTTAQMEADNPVRASSKRRVKLYQLDAASIWQDKGTGHVTCKYVEVNTMRRCASVLTRCRSSGATLSWFIPRRMASYCSSRKSSSRTCTSCNKVRDYRGLHTLRVFRNAHCVERPRDGPGLGIEFSRGRWLPGDMVQLNESLVDEMCREIIQQVQKVERQLREEGEELGLDTGGLSSSSPTRSPHAEEEVTTDEAETVELPPANLNHLDNILDTLTNVHTAASREQLVHQILAKVSKQLRCAW